MFSPCGVGLMDWAVLVAGIFTGTGIVYVIDAIIDAIREGK